MENDKIKERFQKIIDEYNEYNEEDSTKKFTFSFKKEILESIQMQINAIEKLKKIDINFSGELTKACNAIPKEVLEKNLLGCEDIKELRKELYCIFIALLGALEEEGVIKINY